MTTKYIIERTTTYNGETEIIYFSDTFYKFDSRKNKAKRYTFEYEAIREMNILQAIHNPICFTFRVIPIKCRV